jgi:hypothetical protein
LIGLATPASVIANVPEALLMEDGVNVIHISQVCPPEMVPMQGDP